jgi:alpha-1,2-mannosyltransferase
MTRIQKQMALLIVFSVTYGVLFYLLITMQLRMDFASFYSGAISYVKGQNPYSILLANYLPNPVTVPRNVNPPFFLQLIYPITWVSYSSAIGIWSILSLSMGVAGTWIVFQIIFSKEYLQKNRLYLAFGYLAFYSTLINTCLGQLGGILFLLIIGGYYFYLKGRDFLAGLLWGIIIAIKLFPALLFFFALKEKRYKVLLVISLTCVISALLPLLISGINLYSLYFEMLPKIRWYGSNWNASFCGFLFRVFDVYHGNYDLLIMKTIYLVIFLISLGWYYQKMEQEGKNTRDHRAFCLTLVMMVLMSPFGWMYYFSLLIMPFALLWQSIDCAAQLGGFNTRAGLMLLSLFLINFPIEYVSIPSMGTILSKLSLHSFYFYGLLILVYLINTAKLPKQTTHLENSTVIYSKQSILFILGFGLFIPLINFLLHLIK